MCLKHLSPEEIFNGVRDESGTVVQVLSPENRQTCALAMKPFWKLSGETFSYIRRIPMLCLSPDHCLPIKVEVMGENFFPFPSLGPLDDSPLGVRGDLCSECDLIAKDAHEDRIHEAWNRLPGIFGLPGWEELRTSQREQGDSSSTPALIVNFIISESETLCSIPKEHRATHVPFHLSTCACLVKRLELLCVPSICLKYGASTVALLVYGVVQNFGGIGCSVDVTRHRVPAHYLH
ncbi:hypothetical protein CONPUDRAFT_74249 [Coniophora puteana RWD-64-598 SS2]|uniref:Uncharacterized protein n=1 Tax=Coniophora puteana (strain RWD-64-598) TaxID=741705 RepID=A0A5M3MMD7_CONPW|nr:uncharacterized protein CONPUDRAFT_74249 [Coniophora puteana RWD-64-598 SS2]EIW79944.1 hypothetical protein CONPUDRAFT_74249 [Coniophora puteana RWD-64-598 SS2]